MIKAHPIMQFDNDEECADVYYSMIDSNGNRAGYVAYEYDKEEQRLDRNVSHDYAPTIASDIILAALDARMRFIAMHLNAPYDAVGDQYKFHILYPPVTDRTHCPEIIGDYKDLFFT